MIQNIADMKPKARYIVATDDSQTTLEEIVKVKYLRTFKTSIVHGYVALDMISESYKSLKTHPSPYSVSAS